MSIELTPELEEIIQHQVNKGNYKSANEVILAGVKLLEKVERAYQGRYEELRQEILQGIEASEQGKVLDSKVVFQNLQNKLNNKKV
ncbi:type II toxin-antitoxin system ParD family antitoxin [Dactylococcopsis salina]|nr:type II toxin-antitoxin system ParD family antitoxin [Dactylococcopsis salina]